MSTIKKVKGNSKKSTRRKAPSVKQKSKLLSWVSFLTAPKAATKSESKLIRIRKRGLTKRELGKKSNRKIDITIIGLVAIIGIFVSYSSLQDYFKASILSLNQKNAVVESARSRIGITYQLGGTGPSGYDCSGLTSAVMKEALGISLPRTSRDQYSVGREITFDNLGIGDLVFFKTYGDTISHVGVITDISGGQIKMTHANSYEGKVKEEDIKNAVYWQKTYVGAREITNATKDIVASDKPDTTYKAAQNLPKEDEYNSYFPPSERNDPRLKVGAATIETNAGSTKVISDTTVTGVQNSELGTQSSSTPSPTYTSTSAAQPTTTVSSTPSPTSSPSPSVTTNPIPPTSSSTTPNLNSEFKKFSDLTPDNYAYEAIQKLTKLGVINGYNDGTFRPDASVTRAELTKMVYIALGKEIKTITEIPFEDVDSNNTLSKYVLSAYLDGVINGYKDLTFRPQNSVTKAEGSKIILKAFGLEGEKSKVAVDDIAHLGDLKEFISYMINRSLLPVMENQVRPDTPLTRGQTAYILAALIK